MEHLQTAASENVFTKLKKKKKKKKKKKITIPTFPKKGTSANGRFRRCVQEIQKTK